VAGATIWTIDLVDVCENTNHMSYTSTQSVRAHGEHDTKMDGKTQRDKVAKGEHHKTPVKIG
jgi:hypothetical protein